MKSLIRIIVGLLALSFLLGFYFYPKMPDEMATHWNNQGEVNGSSSKLVGVFIVPFMMVGLAILFLIIPKIDPLKANIELFRKYYDGFIIVLLIFMIFVQLQMMFWNSGTKVSPNLMLPVGFGLLIYYLGILCEHVKKNWFIGVRTPWTLSSDRVWEKTNKLTGRLLKIAGIISFFGIIAQQYAILLAIGPIILVALYGVIYSYFEYKRESTTSV